MNAPAQLSLFSPVPPSPPTEWEKRDAAMRKQMESDQRRAELLKRAREARHLARAHCVGMMRYRVPGMVTTDMVNDALSIPVMKARTRDRDANNINGVIFTVHEEGKERFRWLGEVRSRRENSHYRKIGAWCLESDYEWVKPIFNREWVNEK